MGANYRQTLFRVTLPNLKLPMIGAALLMFTLSLDEIAVTFFLTGRDNTLPLEIWSRLRRRNQRYFHDHLSSFVNHDCRLVQVAPQQ